MVSDCDAEPVIGTPRVYNVSLTLAWPHSPALHQYRCLPVQGEDGVYLTYHMRLITFWLKTCVWGIRAQRQDCFSFKCRPSSLQA